MRGVYICSQLDVNASIHTLISRDRGAVWSRIRRPSGVPCVDEGKASIDLCVWKYWIFSIMHHGPIMKFVQFLIYDIISN